ncbi:MAG: hypothetical protein AB7N80_09610 [Bdellovibrionales bacterium]
MLIRLALLLTVLTTTNAWAWGGRGHHAICHSAVFLMKEKGLQDFLKARPHVMGHLCNIPDTFWKGQGPEQNKIGSPTHWLDPEVLGVSLPDLPADYKKIVAKYTGADNKFDTSKKIASVPGELGSLWWRADQFFRRAVVEGKALKKAKVPKGGKEEQDYTLPYNKAVFGFYVNLGLIGHFVGDASMPFHSTADHDGYHAGHGGIHWFYEDGNINVQDEQFEGLVVPEARKLQAWMNSKDKNEKAQVAFLTVKNNIEKMRQLTILSSQDVQALLDIDKISKPSEKPSPENNNTKKEAQRLKATETMMAYTPLIIKHLSRSAALLAAMWDEAYVQSGRPDMSKYRSYQYPFMPEFVTPDYY